MKRIVHGFEKTLDYFLVVMTLGIVIMVALQVAFRYIFAFSAPWTEEMARFMFVYVTFIGSALCMKEKTHIIIDVLINVLPRWLRNAVLIVVQVLVIWFIVIVLIGSWQMVSSSTGVRSASLIWFNYSYVYFAIFFGFVLMLIYSMLRLYELVRELVSPGSNTENTSAHRNSELTGEVLLRCR
jgi:TRAP-type C4-dicarboxylate transport system permease small subunit